MLEKIEGKKRKGQQRMRWLDNIINSMDMNLSILREIVKGREAWHATVHGVTKSHTRLNDWTAKQAHCIIIGSLHESPLLGWELLYAFHIHISVYSVWQRACQITGTQ